MNSSHDYSKQVIDAFIKIVIIGLLLYWCYEILSPFMLLVIWGAIIATALFPVAKMLEGNLKSHKLRQVGYWSCVVC
ncbi:hypothetical membrane protein [Vibrio ishigakensis]|uniref:Hypothetical membrane protein n=1 Tax=Vibrio ishigakensis TaxID=1481914 RepID=A0A0B8PTZ1_9VIBR|nr:hypothetical membrane protein [Vibrio ishigakensis]